MAIKKKKLKKAPFYILSKQSRENLDKSKGRNVCVKDPFLKR